MDVRCPQCGTVFEFDERQMRGQSATLKCSVCQSMFRLQTHNNFTSQENHKRWMVRRHVGQDVLYFTSFEKLHRLIMEQKVTRQDEISRTGQKWTSLEDMGEFMPVFQVVDSISSLTRQTAPRERSATIQQFANPNALPPFQPASSPTPKAAPAPAPTPAPAPEPVSPPRVKTPPEPVKVEKTPTPAPTPEEPKPLPPSPKVQLGAFGDLKGASQKDTFDPGEVKLDEERDPSWSLGGFPPLHAEKDPVPTEEELDDEPIQPKKKSRALLWISLLLLLGLGAGVAYGWMYERERMEGLLAMVTSSTSPSTTAKDPDTSAKTNPKTKDASVASKKAQPKTEGEGPFENASGVVEEALDDAGAKLQELSAKELVVTLKKSNTKVRAAVIAAEKKAIQYASRSDVKGMLKRAKRAVAKGKASKGRDIYHDILDNDPNNSEAMIGLGWALISLKKPDAAISQFKRALHRDMRAGDAYIGMGKAYRQRGNLKAAYDAYQNYLKLFPSGSKASIARYQRDTLRKTLGL